MEYSIVDCEVCEFKGLILTKYKLGLIICPYCEKGMYSNEINHVPNSFDLNELKRLI